jgi:hypothetical protein
MANEAERSYHIGLAVASIEEDLLQVPLVEALQTSWIPGTTVTRYRRTWYLARPHSVSPFAMSGQIGFVSEASVETVFFDHDSGDFVREAGPGGTLVPFAIRLQDGVIAYQLRPGLVREASFTGALQGLLNAPQHPFVWTVRQAVEATDWEEWSSDVVSVTDFNIRVDRPNPDYGHEHLIEDAVEDTNLEYLRLSGTAHDGGVNVRANLFDQAMRHVLREYGRAAVRGIDSQGEETTWVKVKGMLGSVTSRRKIRQVGEPEVPESLLLSMLEDTTDSGAVEATADMLQVSDEREEE